MNMTLNDWLKLLGSPEPGYDFDGEVTAKECYDYPDFRCEYYLQRNSPDSFQKVIMLVPKKLTAPAPAVAVPFYFPEAMMGEEPATRAPLPNYAGIEMMIHLARRGFIAASAESYHLTYGKSTREREDFYRWQEAADALMGDHPRWSGVGKLAADTKLLIDLLVADARVDAEKIGIAGHSLGGKMAFYTGCLDSRVKVILASDFGLPWRSTNWDAPWYWGAKKIAEFEAKGIDHASLLAASGCKPFALLAGKYDNADSLALLKKAGYGDDGNLLFVNHATGHRPPAAALTAGYDFLARALNAR